LKWRVAALLGVMTVLTPQSGLVAQSVKAFEVASIRARDPRAASQTSSRVTGTRFELVNITPSALVARAFGIEESIRVVAPEWARRERFDIRAVLPKGASERDIPEMLQALLVERFGLDAHVERRPFPVYELLVSPSGPKLREVAGKDDLHSVFPTNPDRPPLDSIVGLPGDEARNIMRFDAEGGAMVRVTRQTLYTMVLTPPSGARRLDATRMTMRELAREIARSLDRPVIDNTGLDGIYRFETLLPPIRASAAMQAVLGGRLNTDPSGVSLSRSLEELGLKVEPRNSPVDFIVIDRIERPTPD